MNSVFISSYDDREDLKLYIKGVCVNMRMKCEQCMHRCRIVYCTIYMPPHGNGSVLDVPKIFFV